MDCMEEEGNSNCMVLPLNASNSIIITIKLLNTGFGTPAFIRTLVSSLFVTVTFVINSVKVVINYYYLFRVYIYSLLMLIHGFYV